MLVVYKITYSLQFANQNSEYAYQRRSFTLLNFKAAVKTLNK